MSIGTQLPLKYTDGFKCIIYILYSLIRDRYNINIVRWMIKICHNNI